MRTGIVIAAVAILGSTLTSSATFATDAGSPEHTARKPLAPSLSVSAQAKTLTFRWARVSDARYYVLMSNPDGHSGFVPVGSAIPARATQKTIGVAVHLLDWENATYLLSACNRIGCANSNLVSVAGLASSAVDAIPAPDEGTTPFGDQIVRMFGSGMALSGDGKTLAVSDPHYFARVGAEFVIFAGAVFVYKKSQDGWKLDAKLQQPNPLVGGGFGGALSISADGRTLAIGADECCTPGSPRMGTVYIFVRTDSAWVQHAQLSPSPAQPSEFGGVLFGVALELNAAGTVLAVGAPYEPVAGEAGAIARAGVVYVFSRRGPTHTGMWQLRARLTAPNPQEDDRFGAAVTLSGNGRRLITLAGEQNDVTANFEEGGWRGRLNTLYAFAKEKSAWQQEAAIEAPPETSFFGGSGYHQVEIITYRALDTDWRGRVLAVGVGHAFDAQNPGEVRIYERDRGSWSLTNTLSEPPGRTSFGKVLALSASGRVLAARAFALQPEDQRPKPSVIVLTHSQGMWVELAVLTSPDPPAFADAFGRSLALSRSGRTLTVGANVVDGQNLGAIYIY